MKILALTLLSLIASCQPEQKDNLTTATNDPIAESIEASLLSAGGVMDDSSNQDMTAQSKFSFISHAYAGCSRTLSHQGNGTCVRNVNCDYGAYLWSGSVTLEFANQTQCHLNGTGDSFTRSVNFSRTGPRGTIQTTSQTRTTWDGQSVGGGSEVEQTSSDGNLSMNILGTHKILTKKTGGIGFDISVKTQSPLISNKLARSGRVIQSGTIEVFHNRMGFTVTQEISNLQYSSDCCYPVSGTIQSNWSGQLSGSAQVRFISCGQFEILKDGVSSTHTMSACE